MLDIIFLKINKLCKRHFQAFVFFHGHNANFSMVNTPTPSFSLIHSHAYNYPYTTCTITNTKLSKIQITPSGKILKGQDELLEFNETIETVLAAGGEWIDALAAREDDGWLDRAALLLLVTPSPRLGRFCFFLSRCRRVCWCWDCLTVQEDWVETVMGQFKLLVLITGGDCGGEGVNGVDIKERSYRPWRKLTAVTVAEVLVEISWEEAGDGLLKKMVET